MAKVTRFVNPASSPGGDGTTDATTGANRAYASLSEWEAAEQTDLVAAGDWHQVICAGGESVDNFTLEGWTTNDTANFILISVEATSRPDGNPQSGFHLKKSVSYSGVVVIGQSGTIVEHLDVENTSTLGRALELIQAATGKVIINRCVVKSASIALSVSSSSNDVLVANTLAYDSDVGIRTANWLSGKVFGCTVANCTTGITRGGTSGSKPVLKNNIVFGSTTDYSTPLANYYDTSNSTNNATDDTVTTGVPGSNAVANIVSGDFANTATNDWSLASGGNLVDAGADLTADYGAYDRTDYTLLEEGIAGTSRGVTWDIGTFERPSGGSAAELAGDAAGASQATSTLTTEIPLNGAALVVSTATGAISVPVGLSGAAASISISSGDLTTGINLAGDAQSNASASANLTATITLSGAATAQALANAGLDTNILLGGDASSSSTATGDLTAGSGLSGDASVASTSTASLTTQIELSANAVAQALATASLDAPINLSGDATTNAGASGDLTTQIQMAGDGQSIAQATGALVASEIPLAGDATAQVTGAGDLNTQIHLDGAALNIVSATGSLTVSLSISGDAAAIVLAGADLTTQIPLSADAVSQAVAAASLSDAGRIIKRSPQYTVLAQARNYRVAA